MLAFLGAALLTGLLGSAHCVGMCGPLAASCTRIPGGLPAWHAGRLATYALLGAFAGTAGHLLPGPAWLPATVAALMLLWFALALAGAVPEPRLALPGFSLLGARAARSPTLGAQLLFGVANGFLPCGLVYSALSLAVAAADPVPGALAMLAFGAGTLPALTLAAAGLRRLVMAHPWRRRLFAALVFLAGLWTIWARTTPPGHGSHHDHTAPVPAGQVGRAPS